MLAGAAHHPFEQRRACVPCSIMYGPFGFDAAKGWDPVSGRGTPNFDVMLKAALKGP